MGCHNEVSKAFIQSIVFFKTLIIKVDIPSEFILVTALDSVKFPLWLLLFYLNFFFDFTKVILLNFLLLLFR